MSKNCPPLGVEPPSKPEPSTWGSRERAAALLSCDPDAEDEQELSCGDANMDVLLWLNDLNPLPPLSSAASSMATDAAAAGGGGAAAAVCFGGA